MIPRILTGSTPPVATDVGLLVLRLAVASRTTGTRASRWLR